MSPSLLDAGKNCSVETRQGHVSGQQSPHEEKKTVKEKYYSNNVSYKFKSNVWGM